MLSESRGAYMISDTLYDPLVKSLYIGYLSSPSSIPDSILKPFRPSSSRIPRAYLTDFWGAPSVFE